MNEFCLFQAFYGCHFLHDFHTWGVTFKGKALATKCIFQKYSQLWGICTRLVLKTAEELILPSVYSLYASIPGWPANPGGGFAGQPGINLGNWYRESVWHFNKVAYSVLTSNADISINLSCSSNISAATLQNVYPPCASIPGWPANPPSYVWQLKDTTENLLNVFLNLDHRGWIPVACMEGHNFMGST